MKTRIVIYTVLTILLGVLIVALIKKPAYASVKTTYQSQFGSYTYQGTSYPIDSFQQDALIKRAEAERSLGYRQKEVLVALGIIPDTKADLLLVGNVLSKLNASADCDEIVNVINTVAGCYDLYFESPVKEWRYELNDGSWLRVSANCDVFLKSENKKEIVIFQYGKGYREEGWE